MNGRMSWGPPLRTVLMTVLFGCAVAVAAPEPTTQPALTTTTTPSAGLPGASTTPAGPATQPSPVDERFAYAVGYSFGRRVRQQLDSQGRTADNGGILKGVIDGLDGHPPAYPPDEVQQSVDQMHADALQKDAQRRYATDPGFRGKADDNARRSQQLLQQAATMAGTDTLPGGVLLHEIKAGDGRIVGNAMTITAKYTVALADGSKVFSTPGIAPVKLSAADLLPAVMDAIRNMKCGGTWALTLPPEKAYGLAGKPPLIGPNEALLIKIELVNAG